MKAPLLSKEWFEKWDAIEAKERQEFIDFCTSQGYEIIQDSALISENLSLQQAINLKNTLSSTKIKPWRDSSVGESAGFITPRSVVQIHLSPPNTKGTACAVPFFFWLALSRMARWHHPEAALLSPGWRPSRARPCPT